jgi:predicted DNA-binding protein (MmcQ/YjbR family)
MGMNTDQLREYCLSLKAAEEGVKWEHLCFMVREKIFCLAGFEDDSFVCFKVSPDDFGSLTERDGIEQAPHFARGQWVVVEKRSSLKNAEWKEYLQRSYNLVKSKLPKKQQKEIDELT